jgi:RNA polymerase sigma-70 factor (ECF subfamily)
MASFSYSMWSIGDDDERTPAGPPGRPVGGDPPDHHRAADLERAGDLRLMEEIRQGSHRAFRTLLDRYWCRLLAYATPMLGGSDQAEDVVQDAFVELWKKRSDWKASGTVSAYLYRITRNRALNVQRHRTVARTFRDGPDADEARPPTPALPDEVLRANELRQAVERAVGALPERRREVFVLARFHRLSYAEIAETMGVSVQTVANQMSAALATLRHILSSPDPQA